MRDTDSNSRGRAVGWRRTASGRVGRVRRTAWGDDDGRPSVEEIRHAINARWVILNFKIHLWAPATAPAYSWIGNAVGFPELSRSCVYLRQTLLFSARRTSLHFRLSGLVCFRKESCTVYYWKTVRPNPMPAITKWCLVNPPRMWRLCVSAVPICITCKDFFPVRGLPNGCVSHVPRVFSIGGLSNATQNEFVLELEPRQESIGIQLISVVVGHRKVYTYRSQSSCGYVYTTQGVRPLVRLAVSNDPVFFLSSRHRFARSLSARRAREAAEAEPEPEPEQDNSVSHDRPVSEDSRSTHALVYGNELRGEQAFCDDESCLIPRCSDSRTGSGSVRSRSYYDVMARSPIFTLLDYR